MNQTRRNFLAMSTAAVFAAVFEPGCTGPGRRVNRSSSSRPWYRRTLRWGQTNITEADPAAYDIAWWREYWKRTRVQGVILNAGGIVAYYPGHDPQQYRPPALGDRDLFGELLNAAHQDDLAVLARMDSNRAHENLYSLHPDWFCVEANGQPRKAGDLFIACVNGPYYKEHLPVVLREVAQRYRPEGFADNSWSGLGRQEICYCENCRRGFQELRGKALPTKHDWDDSGYRDWILWNYARRLEIWDENNRLTRGAGGPDCLWIGMNSGSVVAQSQSFRDFKGICARAEMILLDHQARNENTSLAQNADAGQLVHSLLGWDKLVPESMAMYQAGRPTFRKTSRPEPEARLWIEEALAGGLQPWWHHVGAVQEDRRQFLIAEPIYRWHEANEEFLVDREPVASVGLVWSQRNTDFFGRDHPRDRVELPWQGWTEALLRARIPFLPVEADDLRAQSSSLSVLVLPNLGALSDAQAADIREFVQRGGSLVLTGRTGLYDEWGRPRPNFVLSDLIGCSYLALGREGERPRETAGESLHSYLRLERTAPSGELDSRKLILDGFEQTDILPFGGWLGDVVDADPKEAVLTYVPTFPVYPPETSWMREPRTKIPGLVVRENEQSGRVAFLIADLDRRLALDNLPDHSRLMANLIRWATRDRLPVRVEGPGLVDCRLYRQSGRLILHLVNLTNPGAGRAPVEELIPVGPLRIRFDKPPGLKGSRVRMLVGNDQPSCSFGRKTVTVVLSSLLDHQVLVVE